MTPVDEFLSKALEGSRRGAWRMARDLLEGGSTFDQVVEDLLVPTQTEIGERWYRREATVADEHLVTGITEMTLERMGAVGLPTETLEGKIVVCGPEQDAHTLPARMFADLLRSRGWSVAFLGASNPPGEVGAFIERIRPVALVVSCCLPVHFAGVARLARAAHLHRVPVLVGGRAVGGRPQVARRLGSDGYASDVDSAHGLLLSWARQAPVDLVEPATRGDGTDLAGQSDDLSATALAALEERWAPINTFSAAEMDRAEEELATMIRCAAAAVAVGDASVFEDHLNWLAPLMAAHHLPDDALSAALDALIDVLAPCSPDVAALVTRCAAERQGFSAPTE